VKFPQSFISTSWLVRDTFRQSLASGIFWILLAVTTLSVMLCASLQVHGPVDLAATPDGPDFLPRNDHDAHDDARLHGSGVTVLDGQLTLAWGAIQVPLSRDVRGGVHYLELLLAGGVADTLGLLLTLIWTAGFLPTFLEANSVSVLLAKPLGRWKLLLGKYFGVLTFVLFHASLLVGGTWLVIGLRTGVWDASYLWSIPLLLLHFSVFFSFSLLLAVCTRSTVVCVFGSIVFWCVAWGMNYGRHALVSASELMPQGTFSGALTWLADAGYWILPKPADFGMLLFNTLQADSHFGKVFDTQLLAAHGFSFALSIFSSLLFAMYVLGASVRRFSRLDY
jgi:ABC-type transport system involved in multi-copper enzyme maturation permease subunit